MKETIVEPELTIPDSLPHPKLGDHQVLARDGLSNGKILYGGVGSGKSRAIFAYYVKHESPKNIFVITTAKKRDSLDWEGEAVLFGIGTVPGATLHGVLKVDSWNNISKYVDTEDSYFIFDEQRLVGTGEWTKAFKKIARANTWNLLSATPGDTWMDYVPVFVANNLYTSAAQFKREHVIYAPYVKFPKIVRYVGLPTLEKWRNLLLVEMPYERHTTRDLTEVETTYDIELFKQVLKNRWHVFEDRPIKDVGELFRVLRKLVATDDSRMEALRDVMAKHPRVIVFYNFNYELDILRSLYGEVDRTGVVVAEWNGQRKNPVPVSDEWVYLVQYVAGAEAWECITTDAMVFWSPTYSYKIFEQAKGRIDRMNTPFSTLYYYLLISRSVIDQGVMKSLNTKKHFNERDYAQKMLGIDPNVPFV